MKFLKYFLYGLGAMVIIMIIVVVTTMLISSKEKRKQEELERKARQAEVRQEETIDRRSDLDRRRGY